ncbi:MAG: urate hydroxylase PuuD [Elusimicrobiota bacterium]|nr:urate hydroxylase PuuD [Elusimicrobiota bacterium]
MAQAEFFFRWLHVFFGIVWIGHLYFFNFVNLPLQGKLDDAAKKAVNPQLMPRALWWFRWGAMVTFLSGLLLFTLIFFYTPGVGWGANMLFRGAEGGLSDRARWIMWGMLFGSVMWFNVWFIIWPAQKGLLSGKITGDAAGPVRARAALASRINTYLSAPMLVGMLGAGHAGMAFSYLALIGAALIGFVVVKGSYAHSTFVGQSV